MRQCQWSKSHFLKAISIYLYLFKMKCDLDKFCEIYMHVLVLFSAYTLSCNAFMFFFFCPFHAFFVVSKTALCSMGINTAFGFGTI